MQCTKTFFKEIPCFLCNTIHDVHIHSYPERFYRSNIYLEEQNRYPNKSIFILVIYCSLAHKQNKQHYKRILPGFLIPECNITFDNVIECLNKMPEKIDYEYAGRLLGTDCERTVDKHLLEIKEIINKANITLAQWLSQNQNIATIPDQNVNQSDIVYLSDLVKEVNNAQQKLHGSFGDRVQPLSMIKLTYLFEKSRSKIAKSMSRVLQLSYFFDTS